MAIIDFFDRGWRSNPRGAAYIQGRPPLQLQSKSVNCPARLPMPLLATGLPKETKGAVWALNDVTAWTCTLGLWRANMCWIPVGARNAAEENHYAGRLDCEVLFFQKYFSAVVAELKPRLPKSSCGYASTGSLPSCRMPSPWSSGWPDSRPASRIASGRPGRCGHARAPRQRLVRLKA